MERRTFLATVATAGTVGLGGCVAGGRVVHDVQKSIRVGTHSGWSYEITDVEGNGAVSYRARADRRFDVYYFTSQDEYRQYQQFLAGDEPAESPSGHDELSRGAVHDESRDVYEAAVPEDGGRKGLSIESTHYVVVDHSNYGMGVPVEEHDDPLTVFVDLTAYNKSLPI